jgi:hypothetical protein
MADSSARFPGSGSLAQRLRKILYPELTDHEGEAIVVCLLAHLLVENSLNEILYRWLRLDAPDWGDAARTKDAQEKLWKSITKLDFAKKYSLIEPFFALQFPKIAPLPWAINDLRNNIFHGRAIKETKFNGMSISDDAAVERIFISAQETAMSLVKLEELLRTRHDHADRWRTRLEELGESPY